jgi:replication fork protection complex subunit Tof1/Swi1
MTAFFQSIMRDIRMERSKIRPTDNLRCLFLARFFMEYFLLLRTKAAAGNDGKVSHEDDLALGLVGEIAEMESVRWVVMRMKYTMDDKVSRAVVTGMSC